MADDLLYPLDLVYERAGIEVPRVEVVQPDDIPLPYRSLLVHDADMTVTLERHFGGRVVLRPLSTFTEGGSYFRRVLLVQEYAGRPVEMGAIRMRLDAFGDEIRRQIPGERGAARTHSSGTGGSSTRAASRHSSRSPRTRR